MLIVHRAGALASVIRRLPRLGRIKQKSRGASQHDRGNLFTEDTGKTVTAITRQRAAGYR